MAGAVVVDWVVVDESVDVPCAKATPVIIANAAAPASHCLVMLYSPAKDLRA
jgi:hypothetical protein